MTIQKLSLDVLEDHPENANRMPPRLLEKLARHIERTGLYEPLVVRPLPAAPEGGKRFQILNGHHRAQVLRRLGHTHARCDVWEVGDADARLLLATLNRLEGRDDPHARAALVARLAEGRPMEELARLLPEPPDAIERLLALAKPPPPPIPPDQVPPPFRPMTFFLSQEQHALVGEALREIGRAAKAASARASGADAAPAAAAPAAAADAAPSAHGPGLARAERLERLALWYLESCGRR